METADLKNDIKLFPYILTRIAGESFETLELLKIENSGKYIEEIFDVFSTINSNKTGICDELYTIIASMNDSKIQNLLVKAKRGIHNLRDLDNETLNAVQLHTNLEIYQKILELKDLKQKKLELIKKFDPVYNNELKNKRLILQKIVKKENFLKGLLISSQNLLKRAMSYSYKNVEDLNKDDFRTEQSLIKYISRMCAKTSPFSTFTNLAISEVEPFENSTNGFINSTGVSDRKVKSHIRLNGALFLYLKGLFYKNIQISRWLLLRPNPTVNLKNNEYVFLTNFDNVESFQKLAVNPVIDVLLQLVNENKDGIIFNDLTDVVVNNEYIDATKEDLENYILTLIDYGLLEYNLNVSGIDPDWDLKLVEKLKPICEKYSLADDLAKVLSNMRIIAEQYSISDLEDRKILLNDSFDMFKNICMNLHKDAGLPEEERQDNILKTNRKNDKKKIKTESEEVLSENEEFKSEFKTRFNFKPQQIFYEDTSLECIIKIDENKIKDIIYKYHQILNSIRLFEMNREEVIKMTHYFTTKYGENSVTDILTFYEEYFKEFKKPEAEKIEDYKKQQKKRNEAKGKNESEKGNDEDKNIKTPFETTDILPIQSHKKILNKWIDNFKQSLDPLSICSEDTIDLKCTNLPMDKESDIKDFDSSHGLFLQYFIEKEPGGNEKLKAVINSYPPGFGKFFSRFLHLFSENITKEIINNNISFSQNEIFAEDCDYSHFNANIHPPLMPYEVWLPGSQNSLAPDKQIMVTDVYVKYDKNKKSLKLIHNKIGKELYVFDLGFQSTMARSRLFQLLSMFTKAEYIYPSQVINTVNNIKMEKLELKNIEDYKGILVRPRIVYENLIILQRKQWLIPYKYIPFKLNNEKESEYFYRVNEWRLEKNIPEEVFVLISYVRMYGIINEKKVKPRKSAVADDLKPQYINFNNPFLVSLFSKLCEKVSDAMRIDEMLPTSNDLLKFGGKKYVTEFIVQWN